MNTQDGGGSYEHGEPLDEPTWLRAIDIGAQIVATVVVLATVCGLAGWVYAVWRMM